MVKKYKVFTILLILFNLSCNADLKQYDITFIDIEKNIDNFQFVYLSDFTDDIEYIPLETRDSSLLRSVSRLIITDDMFIISDFYSCMAFNRGGKYIRRWGSKGNGPGQYVSSIETISIDEDNRKIYIITPPSKEIH